jgi:hypothetical protein
MPKGSPVGRDKQREARNIARAKKQGQYATIFAIALLAVEAVRAEPSPAPVESVSGGAMHFYASEF